MLIAKLAFNKVESTKVKGHAMMKVKVSANLTSERTDNLTVIN